LPRRKLDDWAALPSHRAYIEAANWYWRCILALFGAIALAFVLSKVAPYPALPLPVYLAGFLPFTVLLAVALRQTWRMIRLRRKEIAEGEFVAASRTGVFLDQHAIAIGCAVIAVLTVIAIVVVAVRGDR
jgi:hypothetical protein